MQAAVEVNRFTKRYGDFTAVSEISFRVAPGEIFGLLGPNGAGKTSTLECLEGLRTADQGELSILGINPGREPHRLRNLIGVQLQASGLPAVMTVQEAVRFFCAYHQVPPRDDLIERMGLGEKRHTQYGQLSVGQQRRLALALAVAHRPPVVFLDEPTAGLDVASRVELHSLMQELKASGSAILLATHDMAEAEKLTDRVAILLRGQIVAEGTPLELTATGSGFTKISVRTEEAALQANGHAGEPSFRGVAHHQVTEEYAVYYSAEPGQTVVALMDYINQQGDKLIDLRVERPTLEERFLEITHLGEPQ
ncbi:MAG TPA: ABC transporter ATP-binding protein [Anaerolineales bacterium]|nr:ABC transporter ATP-binding protein [Anaerolineales bacterium]